MELETNFEKSFDKKPEREIPQKKNKIDSNKKAHIKQVTKNNSNVGYCIRTGEEIPFNPEQPMSKNAWKTWNMFGNANFPEAYCHKTGQKSDGRTSMAYPILKDNVI